MASLHDITVGQDVELKRILAQAGMTASDVEAIIKQPKLAIAMIESLREKLTPLTLSTAPLFRPALAVYDAFANRAVVQGWPFCEQSVLRELFEKFESARLFDHKSTLSSVLSLDIWLGNLEETVSELWDWICEVHPEHYIWSGLQFDSDSLRLTEAVKRSKRYGKKPFVRPVELNLGANRGKAPRDVRDEHSAGLEVMTAFAVHANYPSHINYDTIPGVWLPALEASVPGGGRWSGVPVLYWSRSRGRVSFHASWDDSAYPDYSVPVSRELV